VKRTSIIAATILCGVSLIPVLRSDDTKKNPPPPTSPPLDSFTVTGSMNVARYGHKTMLLGSGEVLTVTGEILTL
jgi:hypothetical protein